MSRKVLIACLVITIFFVTTFVLGYISLVGFPAHPTTIEQVQSMIRQGVPNRSSVAQVNTWLISKKIDHGFDDARKENLSQESYVTYSSHHAQDLGGVTTAMIRDTERDPLVVLNIQIVFFFDKHDRLIDYSVKEVGTGL